MAKNNPRRNTNKNKGANKLRTTARRNINVSYQPGLNSIQRQMDQQNLDFQNKDQGFQSIYAGSDEKLGKLNDQYTTANQGIADDLQAQLAKFSGALNQQGLPAAEVAANTAVYGGQGQNSFNTQATNAQRALQFNDSAVRENSLSERYGRMNLQQELSDNLQQLYNREADIQEQKGPAILAEMSRLREGNESQAYDRMIAQMIQNSLGGGGYGGGGGGGGGGNPPPNPGPQRPSQYGPNAGDTAVGGNNGAWQNRAAMIGNADQFSDLPPWLQTAYTDYGGGNRWDYIQNLGRNRRRIFRRVRPQASNLYYQAYPPNPGWTEPGWENPFEWGGTS